jgi:hypothetical protein
MTEAAETATTPRSSRPGRRPRVPRTARAPAPVPQAAPDDGAPPAGQRLRRTRRRTEDRYYIPPEIIPAGVSYEWKRESCFGQPDQFHMNYLKDNHWSEVPDGRHKGFMTRQDGMVLMERPKYLTDEARREDLEAAVGQVESIRPDRQRTNAPPGTMTRDHPSVRAAEKLQVERTATSIVPPK